MSSRALVMFKVSRHFFFYLAFYDCTIIYGTINKSLEIKNPITD